MIGFPFSACPYMPLVSCHDRHQTVLTFQSCITKVKDLLQYLVLLDYLLEAFVVVTTGHMGADFSAV